MSMYDILLAAQELAFEGPHEIRGRKSVVMDLLSAIDARFEPADRQVASFASIAVIYDEEMPRDTVEFRLRDGRVIKRLIRHDTQWYRVPPSLDWKPSL